MLQSGRSSPHISPSNVQKQCLKKCSSAQNEQAKTFVFQPQQQIQISRNHNEKIFQFFKTLETAVISLKMFCLNTIFVWTDFRQVLLMSTRRKRGPSRCLLLAFCETKIRDRCEDVLALKAGNWFWQLSWQTKNSHLCCLCHRLAAFNFTQNICRWDRERWKISWNSVDF